MIKLESIIMPGSKETVMDALNNLNAAIRFGSCGPTMKKDGQGGFEPTTEGHTYAHIIDKDTGESYAKGTGEDKPTAAISAILAARDATKPLTKAQKSDPRFVDAQATIAELEAKIKELEARKTKGKSTPET